MDLISVIVPVFNSEQYLTECIESILGQTYKNLDIIIVDDGSIDNSGAICDFFADADERITVIHKKNEGVSVARNTALNIVKGRYIVFVDSDDVISRDYVSSLHSGIRSQNSQICCCNMTRDREVLEQNVAEYASPTLIGKEELLKRVIDGDGYLVDKIFESSIIQINNIRFYEKIVILEDELFVLEYLRYIEMASSISSVLYYYRNNPSSALNQKFTDAAFTSVIGRERIYEYTLVHSEKCDLQYQAWGNLMMTYAHAYKNLVFSKIIKKKELKKTIINGFNVHKSHFRVSQELKWTTNDYILFWLLSFRVSILPF